MDMKECFKCGRSKPIGDFYKHKAMKDGVLGKCKECTKADTSKNRRKRIDYYRAYDRKRGSRQTPEYQREYRRKHRQRTKAHNMVGYHVKKGNMTAKPCEVCGGKNTHAHHDDYSKPLDVRWLCAAHHKQWHEENGPGKNA